MFSFRIEDFYYEDPLDALLAFLQKGLFKGTPLLRYIETRDQEA